MAQTTAGFNLVKGFIFAVGLIIAMLGMLAGVAYVAQLILSSGTASTDSIIAAASFSALGMGLGGAVAWHSARSLRGATSLIFQPAYLLLLLLLYLPIIVIGQLLITFNLFPALTFPLFHIIAAAIPPLAIVVFAGKQLSFAGARWREIVIQLAGGAFLSTMLAFMAEIFFGILLLFLALIIAALTPGGSAYLLELGNNLSDPSWIENPENLQDVFLFPPVIVTIVLLFIVVAPLIEELAKFINVLAMSYRRPAAAQIFVWGLAAGAGFTLVENLFNTVLALDLWIFVMLLRIGSSVMHSLGGGLSALGWHNFLTTRRPWRFLGAYAIAVVIHALWNGAVITMAGASIFIVDSPGELTLAVVGVVVLLMLALLIVLTIALIAALIIVTLRLKNGENSAKRHRPIHTFN